MPSSRALPEELQTSLPSIEQIERELAGGDSPFPVTIPADRALLDETDAPKVEG